MAKYDPYAARGAGAQIRGMGSNRELATYLAGLMLEGGWEPGDDPIQVNDSELTLSDQEWQGLRDAMQGLGMSVPAPPGTTGSGSSEQVLNFAAPRFDQDVRIVPGEAGGFLKDGPVRRRGDVPIEQQPTASPLPNLAEMVSEPQIELTAEQLGVGPRRRARPSYYKVAGGTEQPQPTAEQLEERRRLDEQARRLQGVGARR